MFVIGNEKVLEKVYSNTRARDILPVIGRVISAERQRYSFISVSEEDFVSNMHYWMVAPFLATTLISIGRTEPFLAEIAKNPFLFFKYGILLVSGKIWVHKLLLSLADIVKPLDIFSHRKQDVSVLKSVRLSDRSIASLTPFWRYYFSSDLEVVLNYFSINPLTFLLSNGYNFISHIAGCVLGKSREVIENADYADENS